MHPKLAEIVSTFKTKRAFCQEVGIKPQYLHEIEIGKCGIPISLAKALYERWDVPLWEIRPDVYPIPKELRPKPETDQPTVAHPA